MALVSTITSKVTPANNQSVQPYSTGTFLCSAQISLQTGLTSIYLSSISVSGAGVSNFAISADAAFPIYITTSPKQVYFNIIFKNDTPAETTIAFPASAGLSTVQAKVTAGETPEANKITATGVFTVSAVNGWRGIEGGRIWNTHKEHKRMRNLGYI